MARPAFLLARLAVLFVELLHGNLAVAADAGLVFSDTGRIAPDGVYAPAPRAAPVVQRGSDRFLGADAALNGPLPGGPVSLNLVEVPIPVAAKAVLADTLRWNYTLDERVTGTLTLQTAGAVRRETLLAMFEAALAARNFALRRRGATVEIVPAGGPAGILPVRSVPDLAGEPGARAQAVPLRWISAAEMQAILASVAPRDVILRADRTRNMLILSGDRAQIQALRETIAVFDVDWMSGMSTAMIPVRSANPATIARDLVQIFSSETAGTGDIIHFVPNEALGAILVVSARAAYLDRARDWIGKLETLAADRERQLFVYRIQNRSARELAAVLQGVVAAETGGGMAVSTSFGAYGNGGYGAGGAFGAGDGSGMGLGATGAGMNSGTMNSGGLNGGSLSASSGGMGAGGLGQGGMNPGGMNPVGMGSAGMSPGGMNPSGMNAGGYGSEGGMGAGGFDPSGQAGGYGPGSSAFAPSGLAAAGGQRRDQIGIMADEANNSLVVSATRNQYDKILKILARLDAMPTQVLLETVIAEVTLNDELRFGVQWFLKNGGQGQFNLAQTGTVAAMATGGTAGLVTAAARGVPGFNYLLNATDFNVVVNALQGITRVNVISSPNITVMDNRTAKLQVGDQVPIVKQTGQSALAAGAPILNQIEMKDTGVILSVTPRVNKNGLVVLDINQEVSDVVPTTTSSINSPTIRQRRVATSIAVNDGHSLAIGGLVQEKALITNESLPVLGDLPLIGPAFRNRVDSRVRTELIIFIRPRVIRGTGEADRIAEDFRQQLKTMMPVRPVPAPRPLAATPYGSPGVLRRAMD
ncbi:type II secretion system secretin GspD [Methylobacterium sp. J-078]|uniref:type II secretion system secretin GspD n=1 Tax=Methylobacterium sp. J-078 TaxID=2836657 RepID=UPI001FBC034E|nr:type II secretion system secretin GspD [Methylobacterium sp. J-078]MCJ2047996.1 type II secretion system secretin GspD [Methylobacterium sp. J-078]